MVVGCASNPEKIDVAYVLPMKYKDYDCEQIAYEMDYAGQRTTKLYHRSYSPYLWVLGLNIISMYTRLVLALS